MRPTSGRMAGLPLALLAAFPLGALAGDILATSGFSTCVDNPTIQVTALDIQYDRSTGQITFNVGGTSQEVQNVSAALTISAYGRQIYTETFNPCGDNPHVPELCPVPSGSFSAVGSQPLPSDDASKIPAIAFSVPDLDGQAKLQLQNAQGQDIACIQSQVTNGKTMDVPAVSYVAVGIAASALALTGLAAAFGAGHPGAASPSPTFGEVVGWFQGIATNGMLSVQYPQVYQSFTKNFAFSTGLVSWGSLQNAVDNFRNSTGGNLTDDSYPFLKNATLVSTSTGSSNGTLFKRAADQFYGSMLHVRQNFNTDVNGTSTSIGGGSNNTATNSSSTGAKQMHYVQGIQAYVEQLMVPQANTFMTVLIIFMIVIAAITAIILLCKVILEAVAMTSKLPKSLESFRKRYWWRLAKAITNLVLLLYGTWTLYCVYQFTNGDSWAAKLLAAVTWAIFTALLTFFTWRIWSKARYYNRIDGDTSQLFENKETWIKYSLFYDSFKKGYWWIFVPAIVYMCARNAVIAAADGHGMVQAVGQIVVEVIMLGLLLWARPYQLKSGNWINIIIQVVRVLSVVCILVFVEELGISQTTKTITGLVLIVMQTVLTALLAILIAVNAIITCVKENPHRRRRKDAEKMNRDLDNLTPLDARNSLLLDSAQLSEYKGSRSEQNMQKAPLVGGSLLSASNNPTETRYDAVSRRDESPSSQYRSPSPYDFTHSGSNDNLVGNSPGMGGRDMSDHAIGRAPTLPNVGYGHAF